MKKDCHKHTKNFHDINVDVTVLSSLLKKKRNIYIKTFHYAAPKISFEIFIYKEICKNNILETVNGKLLIQVFNEAFFIQLHCISVLLVNSIKREKRQIKYILSTF